MKTDQTVDMENSNEIDNYGGVTLREEIFKKTE